MNQADKPNPALVPAIQPRWRSWVRPIAFGLLALTLNVVALLLPIDYQQLGNYTYLGIFAIAAIANATVIIPIPYAPVVANAAAQAASSTEVAFLVLSGALGSALGESVAFFVGRSGQRAVEDTRFYRWVQRQLQHPWRAFAILFGLAAPVNPLFDVAGLTAGAMGLPFWLFFVPVFLGRIIRIGLFALAGMQLL